MTDAVGVALIVGVPALVTAIGGLITVMRTSAKTDVILGHVNSEKTASEGRIAALRIENDLLREMLTDKKSTAALLAQAAASRTRAAAVTLPDGDTVPIAAGSTAAPVKVEVVNIPLVTSVVDSDPTKKP
jgi:hypothetical protein